MSDHVFGYRNIQVILAIMYLELETDKVRKDGSCARLRLNWRYFFTRLRSYDWEAVGRSALGGEKNYFLVRLTEGCWALKNVG